MSPPRITEDEVGKRVVISEGGDQIGVVQGVRDGTAYVDPDPDVVDRIQIDLDWNDRDEDTYRLDESDVAAVTTDEIRLR